MVLIKWENKSHSETADGLTMITNIDTDDFLNYVGTIVIG